MSGYDNLNVSVKILLMLGLLGGVSLGVAAFSVHKIKYIDTTYGDLIDGPGEANLALGRATRNLIYVNRSIYRLISETTPDGIIKAGKEIQDTGVSFIKLLKNASKAMKDVAPDVEKISDKYHSAITVECADTIKLAESTNEEDKRKALSLMRDKCDPALRETVDQLSHLSSKIVKINNKAEDDAEDVVNNTVNGIYISVLSGLFVVLGLSFLLARMGIVRPMRGITHVLEELAKGNLSISSESFGKRKDEVGDIARAAYHLRDSLHKAKELEKEAERQKAEAAGQKRKAELQGFARIFEGNVGNIAKAIAQTAGNLQSNATTMLSIARQTQNEATELTSAAQQTSAKVQAVAGATEEMAASTKEIGSQTERTQQLAHSSVGSAEKATKIVNSLDQAVQKIGDVFS